MTDDYTADYDPNPIRIYKYDPKPIKYAPPINDVNSKLQLDYSKSSSKYQNLPEIPAKYLSHSSMTHEDERQRVDLMSDKNKYEVFSQPEDISTSKSALKYNSYEPNYEEDYPIEQEIPPQSPPKTLSHSVSPSPDDSSSTYHMVESPNYRPVMESAPLQSPQPNYTPAPQLPVPVMQPTQSQPYETEMPKKSQIYTPGEFTRLYIESQKAKYLEENPGLTPKSVSGNGNTASPNTGYTSFYYRTEPEVDQMSYANAMPAQHSPVQSAAPPKTQLTYTTHTGMDNKNTARMTNGHQSLSSASRYEPTSMMKNIPQSQSSSNYMVPPDRYIGPDGREINEIPKTRTEIIELPPLNVEDQTKPENKKNKNFLDSLMDPMQPVKMTFVNRAELSKKPYEQFGDNVRVVKQVKGKSLLIDPTLENDPARDSIIAQVLEMLNKYN